MIKIIFKDVKLLNNLGKALRLAQCNSYEIWFNRWFEHNDFPKTFEISAKKGYSAYVIDVTKFDDYLERRLSDDRVLKLLKKKLPGMKDVNGREIYEGDIVVSKSNEPKFEPLKIGVVKRSKARAGWCYATATATATGECTIWISGKYRTYEVIGNVHENPELLEAEK